MGGRMTQRFQPTDRRYFIGGSDARIILGDDEAALIRLWREKRGEVEPEDLSENLIVQLGLPTEELNRRWYELKSGQVSHRLLVAKNSLTAADARQVEDAFRAKLATFGSAADVGEISLPTDTFVLLVAASDRHRQSVRPGNPGHRHHRQSHAQKMPGLQDSFSGNPQRAWQRRAKSGSRKAPLHLALESRRSPRNSLLARLSTVSRNATTSRAT
jgi:hypothetical protein